MSPRRIVWMLLLAALGGCTMTPAGMDAERDALGKAGAPYEPRVEERAVPELPERPEWKDVLSRAFLTNGELESAYFEWKAAMERVGVAGAWPNTDLSVGFSYAFSGERMNSFDRTTFMVAPDPSANLTIPAKARQKAAVALDAARAAAERFRAEKFDLQKKVLFAWAEYTVRGRAIRLKEQELALRRVEAGAARGRIVAGGRRQEQIASGLGLEIAKSELADMKAEQESQKAALNALLGREAHAGLVAPERPSEPRRVPADDAALLRASAEMFPEVAELDRELQGRRDALELARMRWIPDLNPTLAFTGAATQAIGAVVVLPTTLEQIRGQVREAEAQVRAAEARLRQKKAERIGEYVALIVELRRAEQRVALFRDVVAPAGERMVEAASRDYAAGLADMTDVLAARRALLDAELTIARSEAQVEKAIVDIECCLGVDIETIPGHQSAVAAKGGRHE